MEKSDKLWSVKAYQYVAVKDITTKSTLFRKKLVVIGKDLTFQKAKELRREYDSANASIFPNVKEEELKIIKLG